MERCGTQMRDHHRSEKGCLKKDAHNDAHVQQNISGKFMEWEDDYECPDSESCECWEEGDPCFIYGEITEKEAKERINKSFENDL